MSTGLSAWNSEARVAPRPRSKATYISPNCSAFITSADGGDPAERGAVHPRRSAQRERQPGGEHRRDHEAPAQHRERRRRVHRRRAGDVARRPDEHERRCRDQGKRRSGPRSHRCTLASGHGGARGDAALRWSATRPPCSLVGRCSCCRLVPDGWRGAGVPRRWSLVVGRGRRRRLLAETVRSGRPGSPWRGPCQPCRRRRGRHASLWLAHRDADPLAVVAARRDSAGAVVVVWAVFAGRRSRSSRRLRRRRRRFGEPRPAWENGPTPPPYS